MCGQHFDWYHFRTPQTGGRIGGEEAKHDIGIAAKRQQTEQNFALTCIGSRGWALTGANPNPLTLPYPLKLGITKLPL